MYSECYIPWYFSMGFDWIMHVLFTVSNELLFLLYKFMLKTHVNNIQFVYECHKPEDRSFLSTWLESPLNFFYAPKNRRYKRLHVQSTFVINDIRSNNKKKTNKTIMKSNHINFLIFYNIFPRCQINAINVCRHLFPFF